MRLPEVVLIADPAVTTLGSDRLDHPLVDASAALAVDERKADADGAWRMIREPVLKRLADAAAALPSDLVLTLIEGFRPVSLQATYYREYAAQLRVDRPGLPDAEIRRLASRHVSPPIVAPHTTGAAVDVTLFTPEGEELDLGSRLNATPEESNGACYTRHTSVMGEPLRLRRELMAALAGAGLVNYPTEWWHWSYGDRYWAHQLGAPRAKYDPIVT